MDRGVEKAWLLEFYGMVHSDAPCRLMGAQQSKVALKESLFVGCVGQTGKERHQLLAPNNPCGRWAYIGVTCSGHLQCQLQSSLLLESHSSSKKTCSKFELQTFLQLLSNHFSIFIAFYLFSLCVYICSWA